MLVYFYARDSLLRISAKDYNEHTDDTAIHFTNWSYQKKLHPNHDKMELLSEWKEVDKDMIVGRIREVVVDVMQTLSPKLNRSEESGFSLFGMDLLFDRYLKPWLLEVLC